MKIGFYAGSFDPFTNGHLEIIKKSLDIFDKVYIGIGTNPDKERHYSRIWTFETIAETLERAGLSDRTSVYAYEGMTAEMAKQYGANVLIRGIRNSIDYAYEEKIAKFNKENYDMDTIYIRADQFGDISSSKVRQLIKEQDFINLENCVPEIVYKGLKEYEDGWNDQLPVYDIGIIGAGPAGLTAALYAARTDKNIVIFDGNGYGGQIASTPKLENYPGAENKSGMDVMEDFHAKLTCYSNVCEQFYNITAIRKRHEFFDLKTDIDEHFICKSVIIATGNVPRKLDIPGAESNIYYCVTCDGPLFKDKNVIVVGSGNTGATYALELATYCNKVYLCDIADHMLCEPILQERIKNSKIKWYPSTSIETVIRVNEELQAVILKDKTCLSCNGIFGAIGMIPNNDIVKDFVDLDNAGYIKSDENCSTNIKGIFVAGDCRTKKIRQVVTATADGATAAINASRYVDSLGD